MIKKITTLALALMLFTFTYAKAEETPPDESWKSHAELTYIKTSGNTDTETISGKFDLKKKSGLNRVTISGGTYTATAKQVQAANRQFLDLTYDHFISDRAFFFLAAGYSSDKFTGFDYRLYGGPGFGYIIVKTDKHTLEATLSALYYHDEFLKSSPPPTKTSDEYVSGKAVAKYQWQILDNLKFKENLDYLISFNDTEKYFINSTSSIETKMSTMLSLGLAYTINYQAKPILATTNKIDNVFLTTLIIDF